MPDGEAYGKMQTILWLTFQEKYNSIRTEKRTSVRTEERNGKGR